MTDPIDPRLKDRFERLVGAVPVPTNNPLDRVVPGRPTSRSAASVTGLAAAVVVLIALLLVMAAGLSSGLTGAPATTAPVETTSSATTSAGIASASATPAARTSAAAAPVGTASASSAASVPITDVTDDGTFQLSIRADSDRYEPDQPMTITATITYLGPEASIDVRTGGAIVWFGIEEVGGTRRIDPVLFASCGRATYQRDVSVTYPFDKSAAINPSDPNVAFVRQFMGIVDNRPDPVVTLPTGTWRISASTYLSEDSTCTESGHTLTTSVTVSVQGDAASPSATSIPTPANANPTPDSSPLAHVTQPPADAVLPYPDGCAAYQLSARRCAYIVDWAKQRAGLAPDASVTVQLLGDPRCASSPDPSSCVDVSLGFHFLVRVRLIDTDGRSTDELVSCGVGGQYSLLCADPPQIEIITPAQAGYYDIPCSSENGPCSTALPAPDPDAAAQAQPLRLPAMDIPIDHVGAYTVAVGQAVLPNGLLSGASFRLADDAPTDVLLSGGLQLVIRDHADGTQLVSAVEHGVRPGTETVDAALTFAVESFDPGSVLHVVDLVVR